MRSRGIAIFLALFLGCIGIHKFYLGRPWQGLLYLLLAETTIPMWIGLFEAIRYAFMSDMEFHAEYN